MPTTPPEVPGKPPMQGAPPGGQKGPPFGASPATQQTPNRGSEAKAMQMLAMAGKFLDQAYASAGGTSELGQQLHKIVGQINKLIVPGASSPASERNAMEEAQMKAAQNNQQMQQLRQQRMQAMQGGGQGGAPGGARPGGAPPGAGGMPGMAA